MSSVAVIYGIGREESFRDYYTCHEYKSWLPHSTKRTLNLFPNNDPIFALMPLCQNRIIRYMVQNYLPFITQDLLVRAKIGIKWGSCGIGLRDLGIHERDEISSRFNERVHLLAPERTVGGWNGNKKAENWVNTRKLLMECQRQTCNHRSDQTCHPRLLWIWRNRPLWNELSTSDLGSRTVTEAVWGNWAGIYHWVTWNRLLIRCLHSSSRRIKTSCVVS